VYGNKDDSPWQNTTGPQLIGNELRDCHFVGVTVKFEDPAPADPPGCQAETRHMFTIWGDEQTSAPLTGNPVEVWVTDSDTDDFDPPPANNTQEYTYDTYVDRWSIDYYPEHHPYFMNITTLSPPDTECDGTPVVTEDSTLVTQNGTEDATDLHYVIRVGTGVRICDYETSLDWPTEDTPQIVKYHEADGTEYLAVDWVFEAGEAVPPGTDVTIYASVTAPESTTITFEDVYFTYPEPIPAVSEWGVVLMVLLVLTAGSLVFQRNRRQCSCSA
jgi:hypothetical protein